MRFFLSLGSNLGDREDNLSRALLLLEERGVKCLKMSSIYQTEPVDFLQQPWFFNQVVEVQVGLNPTAFLSMIKGIEKQIGRKHRIRKGSRLIDIDILMAEKIVMKTKELQIPHPRLEKRNFVLIPFKEISPDTIHPVLNETITELLTKSEDRSTVKLSSVSSKTR